MRPLDSQRGGQVADTSLGGIVGTVELLAFQFLLWVFCFLKGNLRLGLRDVDNGARHAANHDHAAVALALHEVAGDRGGKQVCAVDVDGPQLAHAVDGVVDGLEVLGEAGRGDEVVDLAVGGEDLGDATVDRVGVGDVGVVGRHLRDAGVFVSGLY